MRTLGLLRHAKSSWEDPALDDHDRPLVARGREAAPRIGAWLRERAVQPDLVLVSSAARARETWSLLQPALGSKAPARALTELYLAGPSELLRIVKRTPAEVATLLVIGHNPALETFARQMVAGGHAKLRRRMSRKFPTAALALISFETDRWQALAPGTGALDAFVRPKDVI